MIKSDSSSPSGSRNPVVEPTGRMLIPQTRRMDHHLFRSPRDFESLKTEQVRLDTFSLQPDWPVTFITPEDCAKAGFFYLQDGDKVQCAFCRGVAGMWEEGDNPSTEHRRHFPRCPFVCNLPVGNIPIGNESEAAQIREQEVATGIDVCGPFATARFASGQEPASVRGAQPLNGNMNDVATSLAIQVCGNGPIHKNLVTYQSRVNSFTSNWLTCTSGQSPESLAEAGFAYLGTMDHVKCFYCDGGLRNWEPGDDPWLEHARWFPKCSFVILNKGHSFVKDVSENKPPPQPEQSELNSGDEAQASSTSEIPEVIQDVVEIPEEAQASVNEETNRISNTCDKNNAVSSKSEEKVEKAVNQTDDEEVFNMKEVQEEIEMKEELRKLREATQCKICMDNRVEVVFLPCGHLVSCTRCATAISNCAVCRQPIKAFVKTYLS